MIPQSVSRYLTVGRLLLAAGVALACFAAGTPVSAQDDAPTQLTEAQAQLQAAQDEAQALLDNEEYEQAIDAYSRLAIITAGFSPQPFIKRAEAYYKLDNVEKALDDLRNAISYSSGQPAVMAEAKALRGEIDLERGNIADALDDLQDAAGELRNDANVKFLLGKAQVQAGLGPIGAETLTEYLGLEDPQFEDREAEVYRLRAAGYASTRRFDDAKADLDSALRLDPTDHETYQTKAQILMVEEAFSEAAEAFGQAIENYTPEDETNDLPPIQAYLSLAAALEEVCRNAQTPEEEATALNATKKSIAELLERLPERPELGSTRAAAELRLGITERLLGNLPAAIKSLTKAIDLNPQGAPEFLGQAYFRRGICFFYLNEEQLALLDFEAAAGQFDLDPRAAYWIGRTHAKLGNYLDAIRSYGEALGVSDRYSDAYVHRGLAYFRLTEFDKAITDFNEAIRLKPTIGKPYYYRGVAYRMQGNNDKAINSLTNAIQFDSKLTPAYRYLATCLRDAGQASLATEYDRRADEIEAKKNAAEGSASR